MRRFLLLLLLGWSTPVLAAPLQVAVLVDTGLRARSGALDPRTRAEVAAFESTVQSGASSVHVAVIRCHADRPDEAVFVKKLSPLAKGGLVTAIEKAVERDQKPCAAGADLIDATLSALKWRSDATRRILVLNAWRHKLPDARASIETVMHRAVRENVVVHAIDTFRPPFYWSQSAAVDALSVDLHRFLARPELPVGRSPRSFRHATIITGGTYRALQSPLTERVRASLRRARLKVDTAETLRKRTRIGECFGNQKNGLDGMDQLAQGRLRPSEVEPDALPLAVRGIDLEPLLDAVFDFVDARVVVADAIEQLRAGTPSGGPGRAIGRAVLGAPRLAPSKR